MAIDLSAPFGPIAIEQSTKAWPKCARCSARLKRPYPVESFGVVGRERSRELHGRYVLIVEVECHGETQHGGLPIPDWYTDGKVIELMSKSIFFVRRGPGAYTHEYRDLRGMTRHGA